MADRPPPRHPYDGGNKRSGNDQNHHPQTPNNHTERGRVTVKVEPEDDLHETKPNNGGVGQAQTGNGQPPPHHRGHMSSGPHRGVHDTGLDGSGRPIYGKGPFDGRAFENGFEPCNNCVLKRFPHDCAGNGLPFSRSNPCEKCRRSLNWKREELECGALKGARAQGWNNGTFDKRDSQPNGRGRGRSTGRGYSYSYQPQRPTPPPPPPPPIADSTADSLKAVFDAWTRDAEERERKMREGFERQIQEKERENAALKQQVDRVTILASEIVEKKFAEMLAQSTPGTGTTSSKHALSPSHDDGNHKRPRSRQPDFSPTRSPDRPQESPRFTPIGPSNRPHEAPLSAPTGPSNRPRQERTQHPPDDPSHRGSAPRQFGSRYGAHQPQQYHEVDGEGGNSSHCNPGDHEGEQLDRFDDEDDDNDILYTGRRPRRPEDK